MTKGALALSIACVATLFHTPVQAERYSVTVKRLEKNLYQDLTTKAIIETRLCFEVALADEALLNWEGKVGKNWLLFVDSGTRCDVVALR